MKQSAGFLLRMFYKTKEDFLMATDMCDVAVFRRTWYVSRKRGGFVGGYYDFACTLAYRMYNESFWFPLFSGDFELYKAKYYDEDTMLVFTHNSWFSAHMVNPEAAGKLDPEYKDITKYKPWEVLVDYLIWRFSR